HQIDLKTFTLKEYYQHSQNDFIKTTGDLAMAGTEFRLHHTHVFSLRAGGSNENHFGAASPFATQGVGSILNYSGTVRDLSFRASAFYGSKYYTGYRGMTNLNYGVNYKVSQK